MCRTYDVYGSVRRQDADPNHTSKSSHKFVRALGHMSEGETGYTYMRARYYDPAIGRFVSEDPAMDGVSWFAYCRNSPTNYVDESGKSAMPPEAWLSLAAGLAKALGVSQSLVFSPAFSNALTLAAWPGLIGRVEATMTWAAEASMRQALVDLETGNAGGAYIRLAIAQSLPAYFTDVDHLFQRSRPVISLMSTTDFNDVDHP